MSKDLDISVVGLSCVDCIAVASDRQWNVQNPVGDVRIGAGGLGNALIAISGLISPGILPGGMGLRVGVCTRVGADMYGSCLLNQWRELGIDTSGVTTDAERSTGFSFVVNYDGERTPFYSAGSNAAFGLDDVLARFCENSRCMLVFFAGALPSLDGAPMLELLKRTHSAGNAVIMDVSDSISADYGPIPSYLPYVNLVVNREEGRRITGKESPRGMLEALAEMAGNGNAFLAVTRPDGVSIVSGSNGAWDYLDVPSPFYGRPVRDVVGAGDAFRAGLAAYISIHNDEYRNGALDYAELCRFAMAVSYLYLSRSTDSRPFSLDDIRSLLAGG